jgi:CheY-like chemotaxis protein
MHGTSGITILIADDDEEDRMMTKMALEHSRLANELRFVNDGEELMEYLRHSGKYESRQLYPHPGLILLDLNMPRKDGYEALKEIKSDPHLKRIPVVILTTSQAEQDICRSYDLGVNSFVTKPVSFQALVETLGEVSRYWIEIVELPGEQSNATESYKAASGG